MPLPTRLYRGKLSYAHKEEGEFGREWFSVTVQPNGIRTMRCLCEMDHVALTRDVTYTVDKDFLPIDCFVRVTNENKFVGSGWFQFHDSWASAEVHTAAEGRISQRFETQGRAKLFGTHPISIDIWKCVHVRTALIGETQIVTNCFSSSLVANGASGPLLIPKTYAMTYRGKDKIDVPAGSFDCEHFDWDTGTGRTLNLFTQPGDWLPVRTEVPEFGRFYELVEFETLH